MYSVIRPSILRSTQRTALASSSSSRVTQPIRSRCLLPRYMPNANYPLYEFRRFHQTHTLNDLATEPRPKSWYSWTWIYRRADGKLRKTFIAAVIITILCIFHRATHEKRHRINLAAAHIITRTLYHIDKEGYTRIDFSDYLATLAYFRALILVTEWFNHREHWKMWHIDTEPTSRILGPEDFAHFSDEVDATFQKLAALEPDDPKRQAFHRKLRSTCRDVHSFLNDFNTPDPETGIIALYDRALDEMTMDEKLWVATAGFGTVILLRTAWWFRPRLRY